MAGSWFLDLHTWQLTCSDEIWLTDDLDRPYQPTLWQMLGFVLAEDLPQLLRAAAETTRSGERFDMEISVITAAGRCKRVQVSGWLTSDGAKKPHTLEGRLREVSVTETSGREGCREASQLKSALRDWDTFARLIPHELKGPLAIIEQFAVAVNERERRSLTARGQLYLERIAATAAHARSLGEAILLLAPMSLQRMQRDHVDLSALAWQCIDVMRNEEPARLVEMRIQPGMAATGDRDLLRTLITNLLGNAWKFTSAQTVARIEFRLIHTPQGDAFCVADNGIGFDLDKAENLFVPFTRMHERTQFGGTGLGLSIARRAVELHGGKIWAEAEAEKGARFFFSLGGEG
jgi:signal transduction histidine kinase